MNLESEPKDYTLRFENGKAYLSAAGCRENWFSVSPEEEQALTRMMELSFGTEEHFGFEACDLYAVIPQCNSHGFSLYEGTAGEISSRIREKVPAGAAIVLAEAGGIDIDNPKNIAGFLSKAFQDYATMIWRASANQDLPDGQYRIYVLEWCGLKRDSCFARVIEKMLQRCDRCCSIFFVSFSEKTRQPQTYNTQCYVPM